jgi:hypothetical protein
VRVLVVDGANVVGSVPDGWWRDRAGAAGRLHAGLVGAALGFDRVVLVLEGKARAGVPEGRVDAVATVHAPGSGDDEIVAQCRDLAASGAEVTAATADRGLLARLAPHGVRTMSPRALREQAAAAHARDRPDGS